MSGSAPTLDAYIQAMYGATARDRVSVNLVGQFEAAHRNLWDALTFLTESEASLPVPQFAAVYTHAARTQTVQIAGQDWVIYDQYLGELSSDLTALALVGADSLYIAAYLARLVGQRLLICNQPQLAVSAGLLSASAFRRARIPREESDELVRQRVMLVVAQEHLFLAHELSHILVRGRPDIVNNVRDDYAPFFDNLLNHFESRRTQRRLKGAQLSSSRMIRALREDTRFLEEIRCDELACHASGGILRSFSSEVFLSATMLALTHLRIVQTIDTWIDYGRAQFAAENVLLGATIRRYAQDFALKRLALVSQEFFEAFSIGKDIAQSLTISRQYLDVTLESLAWVLDTLWRLEPTMLQESENAMNRFSNSNEIADWLSSPRKLRGTDTFG